MRAHVGDAMITIGGPPGYTCITITRRGVGVYEEGKQVHAFEYHPKAKTGFRLTDTAHPAGLFVSRLRTTGGRK